MRLASQLRAVVRVTATVLLTNGTFREQEGKPGLGTRSAMNWTLAGLFLCPARAYFFLLSAERGDRTTSGAFEPVE